MKLNNTSKQKKPAKVKKLTKINRQSMKSGMPQNCVFSTPIAHIQAIKTGSRGIGVMKFVSTISRSTQTSIKDLKMPVSKQPLNVVSNSKNIERSVPVNVECPVEETITREELKKTEEEVERLKKLYLDRQREVRKLRQQKTRRMNKIQNLKESLLNMKTPLGVPLTIVLEDSEESPGEDNDDLAASDIEAAGASASNTTSVPIASSAEPIANSTENTNVSALPTITDNERVQIVLKGSFVQSNIEPFNMVQSDQQT